MSVTSTPRRPREERVQAVMIQFGYDYLTAYRHVQSKDMVHDMMRSNRRHFQSLEARRHMKDVA